jgi:hypothetical protein
MRASPLAVSCPMAIFLGNQGNDIHKALTRGTREFQETWCDTVRKKLAKNVFERSGECLEMYMFPTKDTCARPSAVGRDRFKTRIPRG